MIDLFSLARLQPYERLQTVSRSHGSRLFARLLVAALWLAIPFFFLFDLRGYMWGVALLFWLVGAFLLWLAFDVWSSAVVLQTSERIIGAERTTWGRVRVHDWRFHDAPVPSWVPWRLFPWLGTSTWIRPDGVPLRLSWTRPPVTHVHTVSLAGRRRLLRRLRKADAATLERVERLIDALEAP